MDKDRLVSLLNQKVKCIVIDNYFNNIIGMQIGETFLFIGEEYGMSELKIESSIYDEIIRYNEDYLMDIPFTVIEEIDGNITFTKFIIKDNKYEKE